MKTLFCVLRIGFCATLCLGFFAGFIYMIHLTNLCIAADLELVRVTGDPRWSHGDWLAYLACFAPLGFSLIWGVRLWTVIEEIRQ